MSFDVPKSNHDLSGGKYQIFGYQTLKGIRSISGKNVPIYAWQTGAAAAVLYIFGPEHPGGHGDLVEKCEKIEAEDEETRDKEIIKVGVSLILTMSSVSPSFRFIVEIVVNCLTHLDFRLCMIMSLRLKL